MKKQIEIRPADREPSMTDFHTHILPCMDDGSGSAAESLNMLRSLRAQGVKKVVATPHFYPDRESPADFLAKRSKSAELLLQAARGMEEELPSLCQGCEIAYFGGMAKSDPVLDLCIEGTRTVLVEMPIEKWSRAVIDEIVALKRVVGLDVVIAHVERYAKYQSSEVMADLSDAGVTFQINCGAFDSLWGRRLAMKMISAGESVVLGSDCHGDRYRKPDVTRAFETVAKKYGQNELEKIEKKCDILLKNACFVLN
jgi:protein-tyrosine phosphatase